MDVSLFAEQIISRIIVFRGNKSSHGLKSRTALLQNEKLDHLVVGYFTIMILIINGRYRGA